MDSSVVRFKVTCNNETRRFTIEQELLDKDCCYSNFRRIVLQRFRLPTSETAQIFVTDDVAVSTLIQSDQDLRSIVDKSRGICDQNEAERVNTSVKMLLSLSNTCSILGELGNGENQSTNISTNPNSSTLSTSVSESESDEYFKITDAVDERSSLNPQFVEHCPGDRLDTHGKHSETDDDAKSDWSQISDTKCSEKEMSMPIPTFPTGAPVHDYDLDATALQSIEQAEIVGNSEPAPDAVDGVMPSYGQVDRQGSMDEDSSLLASQSQEYAGPGPHDKSSTAVCLQDCAAAVKSVAEKVWEEVVARPQICWAIVFAVVAAVAMVTMGRAAAPSAHLVVCSTDVR